MKKTLLTALVSLALANTTACTFHFTTARDLRKANRLVDEANALSVDAARIKEEAWARYTKVVDEGPGFEGRLTLKGPLKEVVAQFETARAKLRDATRKTADASTMNVQAWFKEYLSLRADLLRWEADMTDLAVQGVKLHYDPNLESEADFDERVGEINAKIANLKKQQSEAGVRVDKILEKHSFELNG